MRLHALALVALALTFPAGSTAAGCPSGGDTSKPFLLFLDGHDYYPLPGGDFEGGPAWAATGAASIAKENETFQVGGLEDHHSLRLGPGATATSPRFCTDLATPHLRFYARTALVGGLLGTSGSLTVEVRRHGGEGVVTTTYVLGVLDHPVWTPSRYIDLGTQELGEAATVAVELQFRSRGTWLVDDVLVDPYKKR